MAQDLNPRPDKVATGEAPPPYVPPAPEAVAQAIVDQSTELIALRQAVDKLCELARPLEQPAQMTTVTLTAAESVKWLDERGIRTASIGILNPADATLLIGIGGVPAMSRANAVAIPPESLIVLPIAADDVELGTEADLSEGDVVAHVFRWRTVQPAFLGAKP
jgi:hypothetical protein